jgi:hypothetical protein
MKKRPNNKPRIPRSYQLEVTVEGNKITSIKTHGSTYEAVSCYGGGEFVQWVRDYEVTPRWLIKRISKLLDINEADS